MAHPTTCRCCHNQPAPGTQCPACLLIGVDPETQELQRIIWLLVRERVGVLGKASLTLDMSNVPLDWQLDRSHPIYDNPTNPGRYVELRATLVKT